MTIDELFEQEFDANSITIIEENTGKELGRQECGNADCEWDYTVKNGKCTDDIVAKVKEEKTFPYIHIGAPNPNCANNSIETLSGYIKEYAVREKIYAYDEFSRSGTTDIIVSPETTDEQIERLFKAASKAMFEKGIVTEDLNEDNSATEIGLRYGPATATLKKSELTRNW